jgi:hypothetical protein
VCRSIPQEIGAFYQRVGALGGGGGGGEGDASQQHQQQQQERGLAQVNGGAAPTPTRGSADAAASGPASSSALPWIRVTNPEALLLASDDLILILAYCLVQVGSVAIRLASARVHTHARIRMQLVLGFLPYRCLSRISLRIKNSTHAKWRTL